MLGSSMARGLAGAGVITVILDIDEKAGNRRVRAAELVNHELVVTELISSQLALKIGFVQVPGQGGRIIHGIAVEVGELGQARFIDLAGFLPERLR